MTVRLSGAARRMALRKAITANPDWKAKRAELGWDIANMSVSTLQEVADVLGIDVGEVMFQATFSIEPTAAPSSVAPSSVAPSSVAPAVIPVSAPVSVPADLVPADLAAGLDSLRKLLLGGSMDEQRIAAIVDQRINHALAGIPSLKIEVRGGDGVTREVEGPQHPKFKHLLMACTARRVGNRPLNVWISGPAASGKTYAAQQVAKAMGLKFYFHASVTASFEVMGWKDAGGTYHRTHFRDAFEHGGVILLDEVDGWDANATMSLNAALENGLCAFPDAIVERHADCIVIAAGNTWGLGATADYVGRNKLDGAFLDRFHVRIEWQYDVALEIAISGNEKWTRRVQAARERARAAGIKVLITPRASQAGAALIEAGMTMDEAAELTYLANLTKEQRKMVEGA